MPLKVFIDTEFTDFIDCHMISLGMAAESGEEFYAEVPYPDNACSAFVRAAVLPLLGKIPHAECAVCDLKVKVIDWLNLLRELDEEVVICYDYQTDWDLFSDMFDYQIPPWCRPRLIAKNIDDALVYQYHEMKKLPSHHALYDALANRYAFKER